MSCWYFPLHVDTKLNVQTVFDKEIAFILTYQYIIPQYRCHVIASSQKNVKAADKLKTWKKTLVGAKGPSFFSMS